MRKLSNTAGSSSGRALSVTALTLVLAMVTLVGSVFAANVGKYKWQVGGFGIDYDSNNLWPILTNTYDIGKASQRVRNIYCANLTTASINSTTDALTLTNLTVTNGSATGFSLTSPTITGSGAINSGAINATTIKGTTVNASGLITANNGLSGTTLTASGLSQLAGVNASGVNTTVLRITAPEIVGNLSTGTGSAIFATNATGGTGQPTTAMFYGWAPLTVNGTQYWTPIWK